MEGKLHVQTTELRSIHSDRIHTAEHCLDSTLVKIHLITRFTKAEVIQADWLLCLWVNAEYPLPFLEEGTVITFFDTIPLFKKYTLGFVPVYDCIAIKIPITDVANPSVSNVEPYLAILHHGTITILGHSRQGDHKK